jgi:soluble lytic murein transglycosylase-like protein
MTRLGVTLRASFILVITLSTGVAAQPTPSGDTILTVTADRSGITARQRAVPAQLSLGDRNAYAQVFRDIDAGRYVRASAALAAIGPGVLTETAQAQLMITRGIGKLSRADLAAWLTANPDLPQAPRIIQIAAKMPAPDSSPLPALAWARPFRTVTYATRADIGPTDASFIAAVKPLLAAERNSEAEAHWRALEAALSNPVRTEWAQRIGWSFYGQNDNIAAQRMGQEAASGLGGPGQFAALGAWGAGLAAFRTGQYDVAAKAFDSISTKGASGDLSAAAAYWASRAWLAAGVPELVAPRLEAATKFPNGFYGLLARRQLGLAPIQDWAEPDFITADWNVLKALPGARRAAALMEIGQIGLGDRELRFLAQTAPQTAYPALLRLAARLGLPATQYSLAVRPPVGIEAPLSARYPAPDWVPARGWRVDRGLVFAHALQESTFITTATSRTGAKGIMQLMPGTARQVKAEMASSASIQGAADVVGDLSDPAFNIEVGQTYLETLRDLSQTQGLLPKIVAAYNAGPGSVQRWNATLDDRGDPLLFIESIPFKETRHYVEVVLRNFWMYQLRDGTPADSMDALAAGLWPRFPGMPGAPGVKRAAIAVVMPPPGVLPPIAPPAPVTAPLPRDDDEIVTADSSSR